MLPLAVLTIGPKMLLRVRKLKRLQIVNRREQGGELNRRKIKFPSQGKNIAKWRLIGRVSTENLRI